MKGIDGNMIALDRHLRELDRQGAYEELCQEVGEAMLACAAEEHNDYHGGDPEERELLRELGEGVIAGTEDPGEDWIFRVTGECR
jgi:hypothetical protein